jgi:hypothetical protein
MLAVAKQQQARSFAALGEPLEHQQTSVTRSGHTEDSSASNTIKDMLPNQIRRQIISHRTITLLLCTTRGKCLTGVVETQESN